jgi:hypothetical protein
MVWPDSTAAAAGLASGDRIVDVNGLQPAGRSELRTLLAAIEWRQRWLPRRRDGDGGDRHAHPKVDLSEPATAPGWSVAPATEIDPEAAGAVAAVAGEPAPRSILVSRGGVPHWLEVRAGEALDEVHEVDGDGRVERSLYRTPRVDGAVELREAWQPHTSWMPWQEAITANCMKLRLDSSTSVN